MAQLADSYKIFQSKNKRSLENRGRTIIKYMEDSALSKEGIKDVFEYAIRIVLSSDSIQNRTKSS